MFAYSTKIFLSIFEMPGIVLGLKVRTVNKTHRDLALQHLTFQEGEMISEQTVTRSVQPF